MPVKEILPTKEQNQKQVDDAIKARNWKFVADVILGDDTSLAKYAYDAAIKAGYLNILRDIKYFSFKMATEVSNYIWNRIVTKEEVDLAVKNRDWRGLRYFLLFGNNANNKFPETVKYAKMKFEELTKKADKSDVDEAVRKRQWDLVGFFAEKCEKPIAQYAHEQFKNITIEDAKRAFNEEDFDAIRYIGMYAPTEVAEKLITGVVYGRYGSYPHNHFILVDICKFGDKPNAELAILIGRNKLGEDDILEICDKGKEENAKLVVDYLAERYRDFGKLEYRELLRLVCNKCSNPKIVEYAAQQLKSLDISLVVREQPENIIAPINDREQFKNATIQDVEKAFKDRDWGKIRGINIWASDKEVQSFARELFKKATKDDVDKLVSEEQWKVLTSIELWGSEEVARYAREQRERHGKGL